MGNTHIKPSSLAKTFEASNLQERHSFRDHKYKFIEPEKTGRIFKGDSTHYKNLP
jgi:hypothetical protein